MSTSLIYNDSLKSKRKRTAFADIVRLWWVGCYMFEKKEQIDCSY